MLPHGLVANARYPYDEKLDAARRFLLDRGITNPRPIRKSLPQSEAYRAWLAHGAAKRKPRLKIVGQGTVGHA